MGAGNLDPLAKGMADGVFLYVYGSSNNNYDVPNLYNNYDVKITSKSYSNGCNAGYTSLAQDLDEQINLYPSLTHVLSAGNDGSSNCGYGAGSDGEMLLEVISKVKMLLQWLIYINWRLHFIFCRGPQRQE